MSNKNYNRSDRPRGGRGGGRGNGHGNVRRCFNQMEEEIVITTSVKIEGTTENMSQIKSSSCITKNLKRKRI